MIVSLSSWGLVHPGTLSVPELCHHIAEAWVSGVVLKSSIVQYKRRNPGTVRVTHNNTMTSFCITTPVV